MNHGLPQVAIKAGTNPAGGQRGSSTLDHPIFTLAPLVTTATTVLRNTILSACL